MRHRKGDNWRPEIKGAVYATDLVAQTEHLSYRQLDGWARAGYIKADVMHEFNGRPVGGRGLRVISRYEVPKVKALAKLAWVLPKSAIKEMADAIRIPRADLSTARLDMGEGVTIVVDLSEGDDEA